MITHSLETCQWKLLLESFSRLFQGDYGNGKDDDGDDDDDADDQDGDDDDDDTMLHSVRIFTPLPLLGVSREFR